MPSSRDIMFSAAGTFSNNGGSSYSNERMQQKNSGVDAVQDLASSSSFFHSDYKKHDDLKHMLDTNKDGLKLEAMKRIISMVAKGKDASDLFAAVVKNVVSKNIEVKKLVYVYLVRYAEDQQDLALLSISTFQRALKDPNQLIRASALRVLSSIRVLVIVPIVMLAIKDSSNDMSPYVRKTAAHAIPKLYSLDPDQKGELVNVLEKLLSDRTTLVVGSAVMAFEDVCPERIDLIHKNYLKLCNLLVDVDEWGQIIIVNMLTRYARTQFLNPNQEELACEGRQQSFNSDSEHSQAKPILESVLDSDHKLLLRNTKPLLQSRNAAVVMAVSQLYYHAAPRAESLTAAKALIRLLRSHREVQIIVLTNIASISINRKGMFESFLKSFFVRTSDATQIKLLKLEILTNLANNQNASMILGELQTYIMSNDKKFVAATIQAIGRCASNIEGITQVCLNGLVMLLRNIDESVVAESVVVIRKLLQTQHSEHKEIISHMVKLMDFITVPQARSSILWLLGEYSNRVPRIAPDVLRKIAKSFASEEEVVRLQTINLAMKLSFLDSTEIRLLVEYIFQMAKYDKNYDVRDRARFFRYFIASEKTLDERKWIGYVEKIFSRPKPAPSLISRFHNSSFQLGTLSHFLNISCKNYKVLPGFPKIKPDSSVRNVIDKVEFKLTDSSHYGARDTKKKFERKKITGNFYEDVESTTDEDKKVETKNYSEKNERQVERAEKKVTQRIEIGSSTSSGSDSEDTEREEGINVAEHAQKLSKYRQKFRNADSDSAQSEAAEGNEETALSSRFEDDDKQYVSANKTFVTSSDLLLDIDDVTTTTPVMKPSLGCFPNVLNVNTMALTDHVSDVAPSFVSTTRHELLNKVSGRGLQLDYRFTRTQHLANAELVNIELAFCNKSADDAINIHIATERLTTGMTLQEFGPIPILQPNASTTCSLGINFNDSTQIANFNLDYIINGDQISRIININPPIGELIRPAGVSPEFFWSEKQKLKGMNEHSCKVYYTGTLKLLQQKILESANLNLIFYENHQLRFAARTIASKSLLLVTVELSPEECHAAICVNCEKLVVGSMLLNEIKNTLK